jgi:hypothetical protein
VTRWARLPPGGLFSGRRYLRALSASSPPHQGRLAPWPGLSGIYNGFRRSSPARSDGGREGRGGEFFASVWSWRTPLLDAERSGTAAPVTGPRCRTGDAACTVDLARSRAQRQHRGPLARSQARCRYGRAGPSVVEVEEVAAIKRRRPSQIVAFAPKAARPPKAKASTVSDRSAILSASRGRERRRRWYRPPKPVS